MANVKNYLLNLLPSYIIQQDNNKDNAGRGTFERMTTVIAEALDDAKNEADSLLLNMDLSTTNAKYLAYWGEQIGAGDLIKAMQEAEAFTDAAIRNVIRILMNLMNYRGTVEFYNRLFSLFNLTITVEGVREMLDILSREKLAHERTYYEEFTARLDTFRTLDETRTAGFFTIGSIFLDQQATYPMPFDIEITSGEMIDVETLGGSDHDWNLAKYNILLPAIQLGIPINCRLDVLWGYSRSGKLGQAWIYKGNFVLFHEPFQAVDSPWESWALTDMIFDNTEGGSLSHDGESTGTAATSMIEPLQAGYELELRIFFSEVIYKYDSDPIQIRLGQTLILVLDDLEAGTDIQYVKNFTVAESHVTGNDVNDSFLTINGYDCDFIMEDIMIHKTN